MKSYIFAQFLNIMLLLQDSRAYYHLLNQIAPKGGDADEMHVKIDFSGFNVSILKSEKQNEILRLYMYPTS